MPGSLENLNKQEQNNTSEKKYPFSAGTALFLLFNFLLILGFCKFSFYVLKNHRSAIARDTLVKTYVDVQPYAGRKEPSSYIVLKNQDKSIPAPFFIQEQQKKAEIEKPVPVLSVPLPELAETKTNAPVFQPLTQTIKRPPVVRPAEPTPIVEEKTALLKKSEPESVSLDDLMVSGIDLMNESDKAVIVSELLLEEEAAVPSKPNIEQDTAEKTAVTVVAKKASLAVAGMKVPTISNKPIEETHWIDIAQLRRQLSGDTSKEEIKRQNTALLEMNGSKQVASLKTQTVTDSDALTEKPVETAVVQDIPFAGTQQASSSKLTVEKSEKPIETAVVQDIPFAGTKSDSSETAKVSAAPKSLFITSKEQISALSGDSVGLWKVAKAKGKPRNALATKDGEMPAEEAPIVQKGSVEQEKTILTAATEKSVDKSGVIYRNGKTAAIIDNKRDEEKSLNWLDRQEAAVWTSMSQSDTPSVWSAAAEFGDTTDRAKAFRVADEQPAQKTTQEAEKTPEKKDNDNIVNSAPVRVVGEDQKPEAKINPILLPLGTPSTTVATPTITPPPSVFPQTAGSANVPGVNLTGLSTALSGEESKLPETTDPAMQEENGLMGKLFSFFGKPENADEMPNIGSGNTVTTQQTDANTTAKKEANKTVVKQTAALGETSPASVNKPDKQIIPTELRLTFKPNSSEISAQSVKWIKAFGQKAKKDIQYAVEVRMSNTDPDLQEKRFALIRSTLTGIGMQDVQIIPVMTDRTPHTIVLRMLTLPEEGYTEYTKDEGGIKERLYYRQW